MFNVSGGFIVNFEHGLTLNFVTSFSNVSIIDFEQVKVTHEVIHYVRCAQIYKILLTLCKPVFYVIPILSKILQHLLQNIRKH